MSEEISALRKRRGVSKSKLTKLTTRIERIRQSEDLSREQIEECVATLERIRVEFEKLHEEIIDAMDGEILVADSSEEAYFEERHFELRVSLNKMLRDTSTRQQEAQSSTSSEVISQVLQQQFDLIRQISQQSTTPQSSNGDAITRLVEQQTELMSRFTAAEGTLSRPSGVKLPVLKLPSFDGRIEDWKRFADTFRSLIHNNGELKPVQKFQYLVTSLTGDAVRIIESIELSEGNYQIAWDLLQRRYDDPRAIKKRHIECLFAMPAIKKEAATAIRGLIDYTMKHLRVLKAMNMPTEAWDELIVHMMEMKLDAVTLRAWEQEGNVESRTLSNFVDYLQKRCLMLERLEAREKDGAMHSVNDGADKQRAKNRSQKSCQGDKSTSLAMSTNNGKCFLCNGEHFIYHCTKFIAMPVDERIKEARRLKLCLNCLRNDHYVKSCKMGSCRECSGRHNTLCHLPINSKEISKEAPPVSSTHNQSACQVAVHLSANAAVKRRIIMATARMHALHHNGSSVPCRVLLDSASEAHLITRAACNRIGVKRNRATEIVTGINESETSIQQVCDVILQSNHSNFRINAHCLIVPKITKDLPPIEMSREKLQIPSNLKLADHEFDKPGAIDILIGTEYFYALLEAGKMELGVDRPLMQNTKLGWIVAGPFVSESNLPSPGTDSVASLCCSTQQCEQLNNAFERFWTIEQCGPETTTFRSETERRCEELFDQTTKRDATGRFIIRLPIVEGAERLGESRDTAERRLRQMERRFKSNVSLHEQYVAFMREYEELGHMSRVVENEPETDSLAVYLPHHGVVKESSTTTRLRVVFDASSKTTTGKSLNDILMVGPAIQSSLFEVMTRFRRHKIAITGDIRQMYRQVVVDPQDRDYQRILWRVSLDEPIREYRLNTVTYGEASSSYLATKCIYRLAELGETQLPRRL